LDLNLNTPQQIDSNYSIQIHSISYSPTHPEYKKNKHEIGCEFKYIVKEKDGATHEGVSAIGLNGNIIYKYPANIVSLGMRIRPSDQLLDRMLTSEDKLQYSTFNVKQNEEFTYNNIKLKILSFTKEIDTSRYTKQDGDIAIAANVQVINGNENYEKHPIFVIRGNAPMSIKDYAPELGLHLRLSKIDPATNTFEIKVAKDDRKNTAIPIELAQDVPRTDYIILQAKVFPGINFYWIGTILMMIGLLLGWWFKRKLN
jgi:cytochrome c-type biogenesis protein CcmF